MGSDLAECWWSSSSFNWFGHQSRVVVPPPAACLTGHLASVGMGVHLYRKSRMAALAIVRRPARPAGRGVRFSPPAWNQSTGTAAGSRHHGSSVVDIRSLYERRRVLKYQRD